MAVLTRLKRLLPFVCSSLFATTSFAQTESPEVPVREETAKEPAKPSDTPTAEKKPEETKPEEAKPGDVETALVRGVPLGNENVSVHAVERKPYTNQGRFEATLYPFTGQVNGKFTQHFGLAAMLAWHVQENIALQITPYYNYLAQESSFDDELINKGRLQAQAATALCTYLGATGGIEVTPIYGKFAFYKETLVHFSVVLNAGVGAGLTRLELIAPVSCNQGDLMCTNSPAAYGDTGLKFLGSVGGGFRVYLGQQVALRLEVRDIVYTAEVSTINGCDLTDVTILQKGMGTPSAGCNSNAFNSPPGLRPNQIAVSESLLSQSSSDVLNNVLIFAGVSWIF
jgi:outer membrane beta-barrel protein